MDVSCGFSTTTFQCLRNKASSMSPNERRGTLMIDEMNFQERISFDSKNCKVMGFTDLGKFTPDHQLESPGDHALLFMFQRLQGTWVQALGSLLAKGFTPGMILHQLVLQCEPLLEQSGFHVDVVTTDGALWNRTMWSKFCFHPQDEATSLVLRRLSLLGKMYPESLNILKDFVDSRWDHDIKHWENIIDMDDPKVYTLKVCPKFTPAL